MNLGASKLLEPSGPVQACNGIALPFFYNITDERTDGRPAVVSTHTAFLLLLQERLRSVIAGVCAVVKLNC